VSSYTLLSWHQCLFTFLHGGTHFFEAEVLFEGFRAFLLNLHGMKIALLFPPQAQPFLPHQALPALKAYAEKNSAHQVTIRDINIEAYEYFLSGEFGTREGAAHQDGIHMALRTLRSGREFYEPHMYYPAIETVQKALGTISTRYPGTRMDLKDFSMEYSTSSSEQVIKATRDHSANPCIDFYEKKIIPGIVGEKPDLIGVSICWPGQFIPALTLCRLIKSAAPEIHITVGGSFITHLSDLLVYKRKFFSFCNSFITHEGEIPLLRLADALENRLPLNTVPGLIYPEGKKNVASNPPEHVKNLQDLPTPDFQGFALEKYLSPLPYLPLAASRSCYWNRCTFCSHAFSSSSFRPRSAEKVFNDMIRLRDTTGARHFYFIDDALPPRTLADLSGLVTGRGEDFRWGGEVRFERYFLKSDFQSLYQGGCRFLLYGLESCCPEILKAMNKGYDRKWVPRILEESHRAGIINWVFLFLGFPGETREQAAMTMEFILNNREHIDMIAPGRFILTKHSPIYRNPGHYGILKVEEPSMEYDLITTFQFRQQKGLESSEAMELLNLYRAKPEVHKFLRAFVAEVHLMFLQQAHFSRPFF